MQRPLVLTAVALCAIASSLPACSSHHDSAQPQTPKDATQVTVTAGAIEAPELDDAQIATIAETIRDGLEERARLAVDHGSDGVRRFARRVLADDPGVSVTLMNLAPRASILDDEIAGDTRAATERLNTDRESRDFDRRFADAERVTLESSIALLDRRLVPGAKNVQLHQNLARMETTLQTELAELDRVEPRATTSPSSLRR